MRYSRVSLMVLAAVAVVGTTVGCGAASSQAEAGGEVTPSSGAISLVVDNSNFYDVDVYAVQSGVARRVGTVTGNNTTTFPLNQTFFPTGELSLIATPIGGFGRANSGRLTVYPGDEVRFYVAPQIEQSNAIVRPPD